VPRRPVLALLACTVALTACGSDGDARPQLGVEGDAEQAALDLGFPAFATKNTTRVAGADAVANAAGVSRAVYPSSGGAAGAQVVTLVDRQDWRAGVAAAALAARPVGAPILLSDGSELPAASSDALKRLAPRGSTEAGGAQVIRIGDVAKPKGLRSTDVPAAAGAPELADAIDRFVAAARGRTSDSVIVVGTDDPAYALPAAGWAAKSGDPVLFTERDSLPTATRTAIRRHQRPRIYVLGPEAAVSATVERELRRLGRVTRIQGPDPVRNAIAFARYIDASFGWGVVDPGHGLVFVDAERPLDAVAAAPLSGIGTYGPLLLHDGGAALPKPLEDYLLDIQPGYRRDPVRGVYNHGWIVGDEAAMPVATQARIDALLEISPISTDAKTEDNP
jgi:hypothetical protein